jgi:hypothetical protein
MKAHRRSFRALFACCLLPGLLLTSRAEQPPVEFAEPFRLAYAGNDVTGGHVIACWTFDGDAPGKDTSGQGHNLTLRGESRFAAEGRFGACLESFPADGTDDRPQGAMARNHPRLTPVGAFTLEAWFKAKPEMENYRTVFLLDKKYYNYARDLPQANHDYCLYMNKKGSGRRQLVAHLGYGRDSASYISDEIDVVPGRWTHVAFAYDGRGTGRFYVDGRDSGQTLHEGRGAVSPGHYGLVVGCRYGSTHQGFPGFIDQVRISDGALRFAPAGFEHVSLRKVFVRAEQGAVLRFAVVNRLRRPLVDATAHIGIRGMGATTMAVPEIPSGERRTLEYPLDTRLRPGAYAVSATVELRGDDPFRGEETFDIVIVSRPRPHVMPVVMWGAGLGEVDRLKALGFTHAIGVPCDMRRIWDAGKPTDAIDPGRIPQVYADLDYALSQGVRAVAGLSPGGGWARKQAAFQRVDAKGKPYASRPDVCGRSPEIPVFCYNVGASMAETFGAHPAWDSALVHTEVRGHSRLCYHDHDRAACKAALGFDIPEGLRHMRGTPYKSIEGFPADRVIPDDDPRYLFYRWWWQEGDGWNALHRALHEGVKTNGNDDVWTFHDPAVRVASTYGNGGDVDVLSHWTYSYPDPIRIGMCADELFAMAGGTTNREQQVMKMTQVIWYRGQTAPEPGESARAQTADFDDHDMRSQGTGSRDAAGKYRAEWETRLPGARFITIAPMHLREAFWTKIARPIKGIMYHGWQSLVDCPRSTSSYCYTHPETRHELRRLVRSVVEPLGPTLVQVSDRAGDVAFLESFASQMFAGRGTYGWNGGWAGDAYLVLLYAQLQPTVLYEETVVARGLERFKVLVLVDCDVLPRSVVDRVLAFKKRGGIVVGDENLCPAVKADILLPRHDRGKKADEARALLLKKAAALRKELDVNYARYAWSENPDVITRVRQYGTTDYLFAVNDRREFGDYVGHHGLVMENALPSETRLTLRRDKAHLYDLVAHRAVSGESTDGVTRTLAAFGPCEGKLLMATERAIHGVHIDVPSALCPGESVSIKVAVVDKEGVPIDAVVPLRVDILDPHGRAAEFSGAYGARDGSVTTRADFAPNDVPGTWRVRAEELASGMVTNAYLRLRVPE